MACHTKFSKEELNSIISGYTIGKLVDFKPFKAGYVQSNILLRTKTEKYVLRYYENRTKEYVIYEADFLDYLSKHNYPCAMPKKNSNNQIIGEYNNKPYILFSYLIGRHLKNLNEKQNHEMIKHLALLHKISEGYKPNNFNKRQPRSKEFCLHEAKIEAEKFENKEEGRKRLALVKSRLNKLSFPSDLPNGVIHGDFDKANIKFMGDKLSGVLDFDDATNTFLIYDIGVILLYWTRFYLKKFDFNKAQKIIKIYNEYKPLTNLEKHHIFDAFQLAALMIMSWLMYEKWEGKDIFQILEDILLELDNIGRNTFYKMIT
jgi:homoserine kinase type II